jgi:hypothetical protein
MMMVAFVDVKHRQEPSVAKLGFGKGRTMG